MHSTTIVSFLFATATIAAPILSGTSLPVSTSDLDLSSITDIVEGLTGDLPVRRSLLSGLTPSVPVDTSAVPDTSSVTSLVPVDLSSIAPTDLDTSEATGLVSELTDATSGLSGATSEVTDATSALPAKRLLSGLTSTLTTVSNLLVDVLTLVSEIETDLASLVANLESADLEGVLGNVYTLGNQVITKLHSILAAEDADVDLSSLQPLANTLNGELNSVVAEVQKLIDAGIVGELIDEVKSVVSDILTLVKNVTGEDSLKA